MAGVSRSEQSVIVNYNEIYYYTLPDIVGPIWSTLLSGHVEDGIGQFALSSSPSPADLNCDTASRGGTHHVRRIDDLRGWGSHRSAAPRHNPRASGLRLAVRLATVLVLVLSSFSAIPSAGATGLGGAGSPGSGNSTGSSSNGGGSAGSGPLTPGFSVATLPVGTDPEFVTNDSANGYAYVPNYGSSNSSVSVFKSSKATYATAGSGALFATYDTKNGMFYVSDSAASEVTIFNGSTSSRTNQRSRPLPGSQRSIPSTDKSMFPTMVGPMLPLSMERPDATNLSVPSAPFSATYDPLNQWIYFTCYGSGSTNGYVSVWNGSARYSGVNAALVANINLGVGAEPLGAVFDSGNGYVYVADSGADTITILNGTSIVKNISTVGNPTRQFMIRETVSSTRRTTAVTWIS